jgi:hypothetical protein
VVNVLPCHGSDRGSSPRTRSKTQIFDKYGGSLEIGAMFGNIKDTWETTQDYVVKCWRSKTMRFSLLLMVFGCVQMAVPSFQKYISPAMYGTLVMIIGMVVGILRMITTMPIADK